MAAQSGFYLYRLFHQDMTLYIGKGSGSRLAHQKRAFGVQGEIIARFDDEARCYREERRLIKRHQPPLNKHAGGNGGWSWREQKPLPNAMTPEGLAGCAFDIARLVLAWWRDQKLTGVLVLLGRLVDAHGYEKVEAAVAPHIRALLFNNLVPENNAI